MSHLTLSPCLFWSLLMDHFCPSEIYYLWSLKT